MKRAFLLILLLIAAACGGNATNTPQPTTQPQSDQATPQPEVTRQIEVTAEVTAEPDPNATSEIDSTTEEAPLETATPEAEAAATEETETVRSPAEYCDAALPVSDPATREYPQAENVLENGVDYRAIFCTEAGPIYVDLLEEYAPQTVNNFVFLAENDYYNNTTFHRVLANFMAQGGDPTASGSGGPGYRFNDEFLGFLNFNRPGWLAMANSGANTNGSQFFITTAPAQHLTMRHTVFGEVLEGQENANALRLRDPNNAADTATPGAALNTVLIITEPETVETTYTVQEPMNSAEIVREFEAFRDNLPQILPPAEQFTFDYSTEPINQADVIASVPESIRDRYSEYLSQYEHQYRFTSTLDNTPCALDEVPVMSMGVKLDAFASRQNAKAAAVDEFLRELATAEGMQNSESLVGASPMFTQTVQACNVEAVKGRAWFWRGGYVLTVEATVPSTQAANLAGTLQVVLNIFDIGLANIFQRTLR